MKKQLSLLALLLGVMLLAEVFPLVAMSSSAK